MGASTEYAAQNVSELETNESLICESKKRLRQLACPIELCRPGAIFLKPNEDVELISAIINANFPNIKDGLMVLGGSGRPLSDQIGLNKTSTVLVDISKYRIELENDSPYRLENTDIFEFVTRDQIQDFRGIIYLSNVIDWFLMKMGYSNGLGDPTDMGLEVVTSIVEDILTVLPNCVLVITSVFPSIQETISRLVEKNDSFKKIEFSSEKFTVQHGIILSRVGLIA